jgi:hypothetical protein
VAAVNARQARLAGARCPAHGQADAELQQEAVHLVDGLHAVTHQRLAYPVQGGQRLLRLGLRRHESHGWARCCLADCLSVHEIALVALDEGPHELRRDEFDLVPERSQLAGHVMRAGTGFHDHGAGVEGGEKLDQLLAAHLLAKRLCRACPDHEGEMNASPDRSQPASHLA